jgi:hypothetical protein
MKPLILRGFTLCPSEPPHREGCQERLPRRRGAPASRVQVMRVELSNIHRRIRHGQVAPKPFELIDPNLARCAPRCWHK